MENELLDLYVAEDEPATEERRHHALLDSMAALGRAVVEGSAAAAPPPAEVGPSALHRQWLDRAITRHVHAHPARAQRAFDRWLATVGGCVVTPAATLRLARPEPPDMARLRIVPVRLDLRHLPFPVRAELELVAWGGWRAAVSLRPQQRWSPSVAWHHSVRYFAGAHAVMDEIIGALRRDVESSG